MSDPVIAPKAHTATEQRDGQNDALLQLFFTTFEKRGRIALITFLVTVLAAAGSFLIKNKYMATAVILPDMDILNAAQKFSSLQDIATAAGLNLGVTSPSQLYPDIMESETILKEVIYHRYKTLKFPNTEVNLIQYWEFDDEDTLLNYEFCLTYLRDKVINEDVNRKSAIITLSVETTERQLSADIANQILFDLDEFQRNFRKTNATEQRKYIEKRLSEVKHDLASAEEGLRSFREKNRNIGNSPQLQVDEARLSRAVDLNTTIFMEITKQSELVKLDEIKNSPVVQVLDYARPPGEKSAPRRRIMVMVVFSLALAASIFWYSSQGYLAGLRSDNPKMREILDTLGATFRRRKRKNNDN
jgi:uncharacterized protein involved in exopolysaccharide biosynthesis